MRRYLLRHEQVTLPYIVTGASVYAGELPVAAARQPYRFQALDRSGHSARIEIGELSHTVHSVVAGTTVHLLLEGFYYRLPFTDVRQSQDSLATSLSVRAEIPGRIVKVLVKPGDVVKQNDPLIVQEAMKMEITLRATTELRVAAVHVAEGSQVEAEALLVTFEALTTG